MRSESCAPRSSTVNALVICSMMMTFPSINTTAASSLCTRKVYVPVSGGWNVALKTTPKLSENGKGAPLESVQGATAWFDKTSHRSHTESVARSFDRSIDRSLVRTCRRLENLADGVRRKQSKAVKVGGKVVQVQWDSLDVVVRHIPPGFCAVQRPTKRAHDCHHSSQTATHIRIHTYRDSRSAGRAR